MGLLLGGMPAASGGPADAVNAGAGEVSQVPATSRRRLPTVIRL